MKAKDPGSALALEISLLKDHIKIAFFILFNSILQLSYLLTDSITSFDLHIGKDALWSGTKFIFMWNLLLVRSLSFVFKFYKSKINNKYNFRANEEMEQLIFSFPFVNSLNNIYKAFRLYTFEYGMGRFEPKSFQRVQQIEHEAGSASMFDSLLEFGPQCVVQLKITLSTSSISYAQFVAIPIIFFTLAWTSNRDYFIEQNEDNLDPDSELKMLGLLIHPWMILIVIHSLITWISIAAILGEFISPYCLVFCAAACSF